MKVLLALLVITGTQAISDTEEWQNFKIKHGKFYKSFEEEQNRYLIFKDNLQRIEEQNRNFANGLSTFKFGVTPYADLTPEEFLGGFKFLKDIRPASSRVINYSDDVPDEIDWVQKGAVSEVKNQGMLGCSEVFSTVGTVEGANFLSTGVLVPLSEQNLADCVSPDDFVNCGNDWIEKALIYLEETGVTSEADYDGNCNTAKPVVKIRNFTYVNSGDELDLKKSVASDGPVNVIVSASASFQLYVSGILDDESCHPDELNHAMLVVGYGTLDGIDYWIVKNSWGKSWGMEGYIWMRRNKNNQCGIASSALYTTV